jgi:8-oxo-dGTP pyrophosphatase MutT (NUDIX family)
MRPGYEAYLVRRSPNSAFAPGAFVFPGGTVEPQDASQATQARVLGLEAERVDSQFRATISTQLPSGRPAIDRESARALFVTALRELFEEAGVLLVRAHGELPIESAATDPEAISAERASVRNGTLRFADFLTSHNWYADACALTLFSHWITPPSEPRRYNTHFFFAVTSADQTARTDAFETHDGIWISPGEALARHRSRGLHLVYPTIKHLQRLAAFDSLEQAVAFARSKPIVTIVPTSSGDDGFAIPSELEDAW